MPAAYLGDDVFPGAVDFIHTLADTGRQYIYLTNNSSRAGTDYITRLQRLGFPCEAENVFTSGMATALYLNQHYAGKPVYLVGTQAFRRELLSYGLDVGFPTVSAYKKALAKFAETGLDIQVTELDITTSDTSEAGFEKQAEMYKGIMDDCVEYADSISAVVFWGTTDDKSWRAAKSPLLFNEDYTAKPAFYSILYFLSEPLNMYCQCLHLRFTVAAPDRAEQIFLFQCHAFIFHQ